MAETYCQPRELVGEPGKRLSGKRAGNGTTNKLDEIVSLLGWVARVVPEEELHWQNMVRTFARVAIFTHRSLSQCRTRRG